MKKNGKHKTKKKKIVYEESPWGDDDPILGEFVKDFLPPPSVLKKAKVRILRDRKEIALDLEDDKRLKKQADKVGVTPEALISAVMCDYLRGKLTRTEK